MAKVLLLGGTGFIGSHILYKLLQDKHQLRILTRRRKNNNKNNVEYVTGHLLDPNSLKDALEGVEVIVQSVQFPGHPVERPWLGADHTYEGLDGQGTVNLIQAIQELGLTDKLKQYLYISGAGAGSKLDYPWIKAKQRAESAITNSGVNFTIIRPSWVYGKGDQSMSKFVMFAKYLPFFPVIGDGSAPVNPLWVEDLAEIAYRAILNPEAFGQILEVGTEELTMTQVAEQVMKVVGTQKPTLYHPKPLMKLVGLFAQFIPQSPLSPNSVEFLTMNVHIDNLKDNFFGVKPQPLSEGLRLSGLI